MSDHTTISVNHEDKKVFEEAVGMIEEELGQKATRSQAVRELAEAYLGRDSLGRWQER